MSTLLEVLQHSQELGFLGPGPVEPHVQRARDAFDLLPPAPARILDLGSGGGLPGLPLAVARTDTTWLLLDGSVTRCRFLTEAVGELGLASRVEVLAQRAEEAGRIETLRRSFDVVVARSFGPPAATAECAAAFLVSGGRLIVAEPPGGEASAERWPADGLAQLGMTVGPTVTYPTAYQVLEQTSPCPDHYPRRTGVPVKRPLF
jgi:16S rRNA (guanine527-N7)-methyltransferase